MMRCGLVIAAVLGLAVTAAAQQSKAPDESSTSTEADAPTANPGRPTVSTPATLTPAGYLQFETGMLSAWNSPGIDSQTSMNEVVKFAPA